MPARVLKDNSAAVFSKLEKIIAASVKRQVDLTLADMKAETPVDSGALRDGETGEMIGPTEGLVSTSPKTDYAGYVHDGTSRQKGQPFSEGPRERLRERFARDMARDINQGMK